MWRINLPVIRTLTEAVWYYFLSSVIISEKLWFSCSQLYFNLYAIFIVFVLCGISKILKAIVSLFRSNFLQSFIPARNLYLPNYIDTICRWFSIFWWFNEAVIEYWKYLFIYLFLDLLLLLYFLTLPKISCMIFLFSCLFYEKYKTIYQHFWIQNLFLILIFHFLFGNYLRKN